MRGIFKIIYTYLIFIGLIYPSSGQDNQFNFHHLTKENNLAGLTNEFITKDSKGLIWISSMDGLSIYDGNDVRKYIPGQHNSKNIKGQHITSPFFEDKKGNVWFSSINGINYFDRKKDSFFHFKLKNKNNPTLDLDTNIFHFDKNGKLWIRYGTSDFGELHVFDTDKKEVENTFVCEMDGLRNNVKLNQDSEVELIICSYLYKRNGIELIEIESKIDTTIYKDKNYKKLTGVKTKDGFVENQKILWLGTSKGLIEYDLLADSLTNHNFSSVGMLGSLWDVEPYGNDTLFVSSNNGLFIFDKKRNSFVGKIQRGTGFDGEILDNDIRGLHIDTDENLWVSQWKLGISCVNLKKNKFSIPAETKKDEILSIVEDKKNQIWVSTRNSGVLVYDKFQNLIRSISSKNTVDNFQHLLMSENDEIWGISSLKYFKWSIKTNRFEKKGKLPKDFFFKKIEKSKEGNYLGYITGEPIYEIDLLSDSIKTKVFKKIDLSNRHSVSYYFISKEKEHFFYDDNDEILIYKEIGDTFHLTKKMQSEGKVYDIFEIPNDSIFLLATSHGLKKISKKSYEFIDDKAYDSNIPIQSYYKIIPDGNGELWLPNSNGLAKYNYKEKSFRSYSIADGLQGKVFKKHVALKAKDGKIWLGGMKGLNVIDPSKIKDNTQPAKIFFNEFLVNNDSFQLEEPIDEVTQIDLDYGENTFSLSYVAIDYSDPESVQAEYRIKGKNDDWIKTDRGHTIQFLSAEPGKYQIEVRAANSDGIWTTKNKEITINVGKPFWQEWWFILGTIILAGLLISWFYREQLKKKLAKEEIKNLKEIDAFKNTVYTNITHEFKTPITIIKGYAETIKDHEYETGIIDRSSNDLLRLINQILDISKLESGNLKADYIQSDIIQYIKHLLEPIKILARNHQLNFYAHFEKEKWVLDFDEQKIEHIVLNLLSNAMKFTPKGGEVRLAIKSEMINEKPILRIEISDTGVGIPNEAKEQVFTRYFQVEKSKRINKQGTGLGLSFCKELTELMGGNISLESEEDKGSKFTVSLPVQNNAKFGTDDYKINNEISTEDKLSPIHVLNEFDERPVVLVIEDNYEVANYIQSFLEKKYQVYLAHDGEKGIEAAKNLLPNLIVSDIMMPKKDGLEVCGELKNEKATSHIPIILLTAKDSYESEVAGLKRGADVYLKKPFRSELLMLHLEKQIHLMENMQFRYSNLRPEDQPKEEYYKIEDQFVIDLREYVQNNLLDATPKKLETVVRFTTSTLNRKLKQVTGKTPSQFINEIKIQNGHKLLVQTNKTISEIAYDVGFNTPDHFTKEFKKSYEVSPREYRERLNIK